MSAWADFGGTSTSAFAGSFFQQRQAETRRTSKAELGPGIEPREVLEMSRGLAQVLWPDRPLQGFRALVPLIGAIAREAKRRGLPAHFRMVRLGDTQHIEPIVAEPPPDSEWPAEAEVVGTERNRIIDL